MVPITDRWESLQIGTELLYVVQTSTRVLERCILMTTDPGELVLDPTCGSGTAAAVAEQWGRRWITCDTSRVAITLARTRLMGARFPWYLLADSEEGQRKEMELTGRAEFKSASSVSSAAPSSASSAADIKKGFVYKRVPHVTLKFIANNPDIKEGMTLLYGLRQVFEVVQVFVTAGRALVGLEVFERDHRHRHPSDIGGH